MSRSSIQVGDPRRGPGLVDRVKAIPATAQKTLERARARSGIVDVVVRTFKRYSEDDAGSYAAALTYYSFFAIFPLLLFAAAGIGYATFGNEELTQRLVTRGVKSVPLIRDAMTPDGLTMIQKNKDTIAGIGFALALYTGTGMIVALEHALNKVHRLADEGNWFEKRVKALRWLVVIGLSAAASLGLTSVASTFEGVLGKGLGYLGAFVIDAVIFATAFKFLPAARWPWRDVMPGALVAAIAFSVLKALGASYLAQGEATRNATYGTLAGAATLLVASYLISQVTLLAAEVNATLIERRKTRTAASERTEETA